MFPIYILKEGVKLPKEGIYYVVTKEGIYLHKETGIITALVKVKGISFLEKLQPNVTLNLPKLPPELIVKSLLFFRRVYQRYKAEAIVLLHYSQENGFLVHCPEQKIGGVSVDYNSSERFEGYQLVGTIHSHSDFGAFHSGVDKKDERYFDGIHLVIGKVNLPYFTFKSSIVVNNNRFKMKPEGIIRGIREVDYTPPIGILERVIYRRQAIPRVQSDFSNANDKIDDKIEIGDADLPYEPVKFYEVILPDGKDYRSCAFPRQWLKKVEYTKPDNVEDYGDLMGVSNKPILKRGGEK